jgi:TatD DNase family protein
MIDCHAHVFHEKFDQDREKAIDRARQAGVKIIIAVSENIDDSRRVPKMCRKYPDVLLPCMGIHPDAFAEDRQAPSDSDIETIVALIRANRQILIGIGEVGLDYWVVKNEEGRLRQQAFLSQMVDLSNELSLPLNVHSRSAGHYTLDLLARRHAKKVLLHAFDGKAGYALQAAGDHGWIFSIPPSIVRSSQKQKLVKALSLDSLALESDSPALGPDPRIRNEPSNLVLALRCIAEIKGESEEKVRDITTQNAQLLFGLD